MRAALRSKLSGALGGKSNNDVAGDDEVRRVDRLVEEFERLLRL